MPHIFLPVWVQVVITLVILACAGYGAVALWFDVRDRL
jgi:hypothetical protein